MQPTQQTKSDGFQIKWRTFHPQSIVWVLNPFDYDVEFDVADEANNQYHYRILAGDTVELPGGSVATLGVKKIVDEMIQNNPTDVFSMWEKAVREKYEEKIIIRVKQEPANEVSIETGEIVLKSIKKDTKKEEVEKVEVKEEKPVFPKKSKKPSDKPDFAKVDDKKDVVIEEE